MRINHNIAALNTYRQFGAANAAQGKSMEKLSSGLRINNAADDAAGLAISEKMRGQIRGLDMASKNAQDATSLIQTAEGALNETHDILQRMRELAVQASNDTNTGDDRAEIQKEINQLTSEVNRIGNTTEFNTKKLLNGDFEKTEIVTANLNGKTVGNSLTITNSDSAGNAISSDISAALAAGTGIKLHTGLGGSAEGNVDVSAGVTVTAADNELTLKVDGEEVTVTVAAQAYSTPGDLETALESAINTATSGTDVAVTRDATTGGIIITSGTTGASSSVEIVGGGFATTWMSTATDMSDINEQAGQTANNTFDVTVDGTTQTVTVAASDYSNGTTLASAIETGLDNAFGSNVANATYASNKLTITSGDTGSDSSVTNISGAAASALGFSSPTYTAGTDRSDQFNITVDGEEVNITGLATGSVSSSVLAAQLQDKINTATNTAADVSVSYADGKFSITSGTEGSGGSIQLDEGGFATLTGLSVTNGANSTMGADAENASLKFQIGANQGQSMDIVVGDMRGVNLGISADVDNATKVLQNSAGEDVTVSYTTGSENVTNGTNNASVEFALDVSSAEKASAAILALDESIASVSAERSRLGSYQNRLEHTINNLGTSSENLTAAESRIRDVDYALAA